MKLSRNYRTPVEQVNEILDQNARVLAMNEKLLNAITKHHNVSHVAIGPQINVDELTRNVPK